MKYTFPCAALAPLTFGLFGFALQVQSVAQTPIRAFTGQQGDFLFGQSASSAGDVDADGFADIIAGSIYADGSAVSSGSAFVYSGQSGDLIHWLQGDTTHGLFGSQVAEAGDVNADGHSDVIVGAPQSDWQGIQSGYARVFSGKNGSILHTFAGAQAGDRFGQQVASAGDVNADGHADLMVSAKAPTSGTQFLGHVWVFSGATGQVLHSIPGVVPGAGFGKILASIGDVNADGLDDFAVSSPADPSAVFDHAGSVTAYSGATGQVLYRIEGDFPGQEFGGALAGIGDANGDGIADLAIGSPNAGFTFEGSGRAEVYSGLDGTLLWRVDGAYELGFLGQFLDGIGDINGDGHFDVAVGATGVIGKGSPDVLGKAFVFSGFDGSVLRQWDSPVGVLQFASPLASAGDVDGDGFEDLLVGSPRLLTEFFGRLEVYLSRDAEQQEECTPAVVNSSGASAVVRFSGTASLSFEHATLAANQLPQNVTTMFLTSMDFGGPVTPIGSLGSLCLGGAIGRFNGANQVGNSGAAGAFSLDLDLDAQPTPQGPVVVVAAQTWRFQAWFRDQVSGMSTSNFTNSVAVTFR